MYGEAGRPHGRVGGEGGAVGGDGTGRLDAGDGGVLVHGDAEPVERAQHVTAGLRAQPAPELAGGGEGDPQPGPEFGELGGGLDRGQVAADDQRRPVLVQPVQVVAQALRRRPVGDVEGMLAHARRRRRR
jgi:hypothetical protein